MKLAAAVVLLSTALALSGCGGKSGSSYPEAYMLRGLEIPAGLELADASKLPGEYKFDNPGPVPPIIAGAVFEQFAEFAPDEVWAEVLEPEGAEGDDASDELYIFGAGKWKDGTRLDKAIASIEDEVEADLCETDGLRVLRDGSIVVAALNSGGDDAMLDKIVKRIQVAAPGLKDFCAA